MMDDRQFRLDTGLALYFCDSLISWQRGSNENTEGLSHQFLPKGKDISRNNEYELDAVADTLNNRPRKALDWKTPMEAFDNLLYLTR